MSFVAARRPALATVVTSAMRLRGNRMNRSAVRLAVLVMAVGATLSAQRGWAIIERGTKATAPRKPTLWVLAVGVSHYKDSALTLRYADADARAVAAALEVQARSGLYAEVKKTVLVNDEVTRERIIKTIKSFRTNSGPEDVVVLFFAGHGEQASDRYYFLPYPAANDDFEALGLGWADIRAAVEDLHRHGQWVIVLLDTCDAGALNIASERGQVSFTDVQRDVTVSEGSFLLAAATSGHPAMEDAQWEHGAFTKAFLDGIHGKAPSDDDGVISLLSLFAYISREVPQLSPGQHPFSQTAGTDLGFAVSPTHNQGHASLPNDPSPKAVQANSVYVMPFENLGGSPEAGVDREVFGKLLQREFITQLTKVTALTVIYPGSIAVATDNPYPALQARGIEKLITGTVVRTGSHVAIYASIVDIATGKQEGAESVEGDGGDDALFRLQKELVAKTLDRLPVTVLAAEAAKINRDNDNNVVDAYNLLLQAEGVVERNQPAKAEATPVPLLPAHPPWQWWRKLFFNLSWSGWTDVAQVFADDAEAQIHKLLDDYKQAYGAKDMAGLAQLHVSFTQDQADAIQAYFQKAEDLSVDIEDVVVTQQNGTVSVEYLRRDHFIERATGRKITLEVRVKKLLVREDGAWKIGGSA